MTTDQINGFINNGLEVSIIASEQKKMQVYDNNFRGRRL